MVVTFSSSSLDHLEHLLNVAVFIIASWLRHGSRPAVAAVVVVLQMFFAG